MSYSEFGFFLGGVRVLSGGIGQGLLLVLDVADPGADTLDGVEAWVLSGCQGRGGTGIRVADLGFLLLFCHRRNLSRGPHHYGRGCP